MEAAGLQEDVEAGTVWFRLDQVHALKCIPWLSLPLGGFGPLLKPVALAFRGTSLGVVTELRSWFEKVTAAA